MKLPYCKLSCSWFSRCFRGISIGVVAVSSSASSEAGGESAPYGAGELRRGPVTLLPRVPLRR
jgi:hypothetical protein